MKTPKSISESELILNPDGSVYHINLRPEHVADNVIVVGDQERVKKISDYFEKVEYKLSHREFVTHTGFFKGKRITVVSTGIGPDNIDIVLNELDAAVNIDLQTRRIKEKKKNLNIIRIGTSGALQKEIPVDSFVVSEFGLGIDNLMSFYHLKQNFQEKNIEQDFIRHTGWSSPLSKPYIVQGSELLIKRIGAGMREGITVTAPGFYGPQGRILRLKPSVKNLNEKLTSFSPKPNFKKNISPLKITNFEMETSALYGLGRALGHNCCTVCAIIANRIIKQYSKNTHKSIDLLIRTVLERI